MRRKLLIALMSIITVVCCALGLTACIGKVHAESITLNETELNLFIGEEATLIATVRPDNATDKTVNWSVNDDRIVTVQDGKVTAVAEGSTIITAYTEYLRADCTVTVNKKIEADYIFMDDRLTVKKDEQKKLEAKVRPDDAYDKTVIWSVENDKIATVSTDGTVTGIAQGVTVVTAKAGDVTAECEIIITEDMIEYQLNKDGQSYTAALSYASDGITELTIAQEFNGKPVTAMGDYLLDSFEEVKSVKIPSTVTELSFFRAFNLVSVTIDPNNPKYTSIDGIVYDKDVTEFVHVPEAIKGTVTIPETVTEIGKSAFSGCKLITEVKMHDGITAIREFAFSGCEGLTSFTVTKNITEIESWAFNGCLKIWEIYNFSNLKIVAGINAFGGIAEYALNIFYNENDVSGVDRTDGDFVFCTARDEVYLVDYTGEATDIVLPDDYKGKQYIIHSCAFAGNKALTSVIISDGVTDIEPYAFENCSGLKEVTIGANVTQLDRHVFRYCGEIEKVNLSTTVTFIDGWAFSGISDIYFDGTVEQWKSIDRGYGTDNLEGCTVHCTDGEYIIEKAEEE